MATHSDPETVTAVATAQLRDFWEYYRRYTKTGVHAAATAALTAFGLLIFIDSLFAWVAIAAYVCPPAILYLTGNDAETHSARDPNTGDHPDGAALHGDAGMDTGGTVDADTDGADFDFDGPDRDADGIDLDFDGPDRDTDGRDVDTDGADADADGDARR